MNGASKNEDVCDHPSISHPQDEVLACSFSATKKAPYVEDDAKMNSCPLSGDFPYVKVLPLGARCQCQQDPIRRMVASR